MYEKKIELPSSLKCIRNLDMSLPLVLALIYYSNHWNYPPPSYITSSLLHVDFGVYYLHRKSTLKRRLLG
jgi:hypothetical protein